MSNNEYIGVRFNKLTVIEICGGVKYKSGAKPLVKCECECGKVIVCRLASLKNNHTKSCGCIHIKNKYSEIKDRHKDYRLIYGVWSNIHKRCFDAKSKFYNDYGGRGIIVEKEWKNNFKSFYDWAVNNGYQKGLELDRRDNDKGYSSSNCRWVSGVVNMRNTRKNVIIEYNGEKRTMAEWAEVTGLSYYVIRRRRNLGWADKDLFLPVSTAKIYRNKKKRE